MPLPHPEAILYEIIHKDISEKQWLKDKPYSLMALKLHCEKHNVSLTVHKYTVQLYVTVETYTRQRELAQQAGTPWTRWARRQLLDHVFWEPTALIDKHPADIATNFQINNYTEAVHGRRPYKHSTMDHHYRMCAQYNVHPIAVRRRLKQLHSLDHLPRAHKRVVTLPGISEQLLSRLALQATDADCSLNDLILDILGAATYASPVPENRD